MDLSAAFEVDLVPPVGAVPTAGAVSRRDSLLAVGLDDGGAALYRSKHLGPDMPPPGRLPGLFDGPCSGAQVGSRGVTLLGIDAGEQARSADRSALVHLPHRPGLRALRVPLGPGDWALVKGGTDDTILVYDTETGRGMRSVDGSTGTLHWESPVGPVERVVRAGGELLGVSPQDELVCLSEATGEVSARHRLPSRGRYRWTAWTVIEPGRLLLAGFDARHEYVLAFWRTGTPRAELLAPPTPAADHFPEHLCPIVAPAGLDDGFRNKIRRPMRDQRLTDVSQRRLVSADIAMQHRVAAVRLLDDDHILVVLGGDAEARGVTHGGCVASVVHRGEPKKWRQQLLDEDYGCSALVPSGSGRWLLDCGGRLRSMRPRLAT